MITMLIIAFGVVRFETFGRGADVPPDSLNNFEPGAVLSFDSDWSRVFLSAMVNGTGPHRFLVDTGYGLTMVQPELVDELNPPRAGRVDIIGIAGRETATMYRDVAFEFGLLAYRPRRVAALPSDRGRRRGRQGVLGSGFFREFVVVIDFPASEVRLFEPDKFNYSGPGEIIPLRFEDKIPVIDTWLESPDGARVKAAFELDTGCDGDLCLGRRFIAEHKWVQSEERRDATRRGVGGSTRTETSDIPCLMIGTNRWTNVPANLFLENDLVEEGYAGHIGCAVLRPFKVIFDYSRERLILESND
jgi:predicted aspartyl protease